MDVNDKCEDKTMDNPNDETEKQIFKNNIVDEGRCVDTTTSVVMEGNESKTSDEVNDTVICDQGQVDQIENEDSTLPSTNNGLNSCYSAYRNLDDNGTSDGDSDSSSVTSSTSSPSDNEDKDKSDNTQNISVQARTPQNHLDADFTEDKNFGKHKVKGETFIENLPPIEDLKITVDENVEMTLVGSISTIVDTLAVIQSVENSVSPLNDDSILFFEDRTPLGQVFEVFGLVRCPLYSVRFNSSEDIKQKGIEVGLKVYYAPNEEQFTNYVFVADLKRLKGSDASWEHDLEPPTKFLDFSDDEQERQVKKKGNKKNSNNGTDNNKDCVGNNQRSAEKKPKQSYSNKSKMMEHNQKWRNFGGSSGSYSNYTQFSPRLPSQQYNLWPPNVPNSWSREHQPQPSMFSSHSNQWPLQNERHFGNWPPQNGSRPPPGQQSSNDIPAPESLNPPHCKFDFQDTSYNNSFVPPNFHSGVDPNYQPTETFPSLHFGYPGSEVSPSFSQGPMACWPRNINSAVPPAPDVYPDTRNFHSAHPGGFGCEPQFQNYAYQVQIPNRSNEFKYAN